MFISNKKKRNIEESTGELANSSPNDDKNVPERKTMTVSASGYVEAFEDIVRPNVESASLISIKNDLQKI
jgi:hypothetical protein